MSWLGPVTSGVLATVIGGVVVLGIEYGYLQRDRDQQGPSDVVIPPPRLPSANTFVDQRAERPAADLDSRIKEMHDTTKQISSVSSRDAEMSRLVEFARSHGRLGAAAEVADSISSVSVRDAAFASIIRAAITTGQLSTARRLSDQIRSPSFRDSVIREILKAATSIADTDAAQ